MFSHRYKTFVCLCRKRNKNRKDTSFEGIGCHYVRLHQVYCLMVPLILNFLFDEKRSRLLIQNHFNRCQPTFPTQLNKHETPCNETKRNPRSATIQEMQLNDLVPGEIYNISVSAVSAAGIGPLTSEIVPW